MEAQLGPAPENVLGAAGPLVLDEVVDLAGRKACAEILTEVGDGPGIAEQDRGLGAVEPDEALDQLARQFEVAGGSAGDLAGKIGRRKIAAGQLEAQVLAVLWVAPQPLTPAQIHTNLDPRLAYNTVHTILTRLCDKDQVQRTTYNGRAAYLPTRNAAEWSAGQMRAVLDRGTDRGTDRSAVLHQFVCALDPDDEQTLRAALRHHHAEQKPKTRHNPDKPGKP